MKCLLILPALFLATAGLAPVMSFGQNFLEVDKRALNTPPSKTASIKTLAAYLCAEAPDDTYKIRAIFAWISLNVAYVDSTDERDIWATPEQIARQRPERVLQNHTAVCQGYANLFCALATEVGLPCEVVTGIVKNAEGEVQQIGHAWAAARIAGEWRLFDPTWAVPPPGMLRWKVIEKYFMADPKQFLLQHLPDDPVWQLLENPVTERQFRNSSDEELLTLLEKNPEGDFRFRDTLNNWVSMNFVNRRFASESRTLQFNGSNERVIFGLGQSYWGLFFELRGLLDSLTNAAIIADTVQVDTVWFEAQFSAMQRYHARARTLFEQLETPERIEKAEKFYTPEDVAALLEEIRGDMRTGVFEYLLHTMPEGVLEESQIIQLHYQFDLARQSFAEAEQILDCKKMPGDCFEIHHNRSLMSIQLAQRLVRQAQDLASDRMASKNLITIGLRLQEARLLFFQAIEDCEQMRRRPPNFAFVAERITVAKQGLLTLRACEIRADRTALTPEMEAVLNAQNLPANKAENLALKMSNIARSIEGLQDSLREIKADLGIEYAQMASFNLQLEAFTLKLNLANLLFRISLSNYDKALNKNTLADQRPQIRKDGNRALQTLEEASTALDFLEDSGRLPEASISQKQLQINKLSKTIKEFLKDF